MHESNLLVPATIRIIETAVPDQVNPQPTEARSAESSTASKAVPLLMVWLRDLVLSLGISAFIIIFLYQPVKVEGTSMMPSLEDQERIFVNKFVYRLEPIERGDVVVFRYPYDPSKSYIKRVIGMAGDRIRIDGGLVYVNSKPLDEEYVPAEYTDTRSYPETIVPPSSYFVLG